YSWFDFKKHTQLVEASLERWRSLLARFEKVVCIRVPIKQQLVPANLQNDVLKSTLESYDTGWSLMKSNLKLDRKISFYEPKMFSLSHYRPWDTHWNASGNAAFAEYL